MSLECLCVKRGSGSLKATGGILRAKMSCAPACVKVKAEFPASIIAGAGRERGVSTKLVAEAHITPKETVAHGVKPKLVAEGHINPGLTANYALNQEAEETSSFTSSYTDKFAGGFEDYGCYHKLYPISDITTELNGSYFVDASGGTSNLYQNIDEGIFTGSYHTQFGNSRRISDDIETFIHASSVYTPGAYRYKCEVTNPVVTGKESRIYIRAAAPVANFSSRIPPEYKLHNIKLEDPSGNLIISYEDITLRGDTEYDDPSHNTYINYTTYGSKPKVNNWNLHTWQSGYPVMQPGGGYTLTLDLDIKCLDDPYNEGFNVGFEDTCKLDDVYVGSSNEDYLALDGAPLSTQYPGLGLNPTNTLRISAIEICNSGGYNTIQDHYTPIFIEVQPTGRRIDRCILPSVLSYDFETGIYPAATTIWSNHNQYTNQSGVGLEHLTASVRDEQSWSYITLDSTSPIPDSGKLNLNFKHDKPEDVWTWQNGAFGVGYLKQEYNAAYIDRFRPADSFFTIDSVKLRVKAKKEVGSRDYSLDVVGWSDDGILNVTPAAGGFLQNISGLGDEFAPVVSGYNITDYQALAGESFSDQDQYYESSGTNNAGGDHYLLSNTPLVTGTLFEWYEIPLKIYEDKVSLGEPTDYSMSSHFENLYMDIFPLPSGASIAAIELCITHKPSNAMHMSTVGSHLIERIEKYRSEGKLFPRPLQSGVLEFPRRSSPNGIIFDKGTNYAPLSSIENIPHAYTSPTTAKSNYARRWRGLGGLAKGPFDPDMFGFGFENPLLDSPFLSGIFTFDNDSGVAINSRPLGDGYGTLSGVLTSNYSQHHFNNLGWRFSSGSLFEDHLPGWSGNYTTTDWTSLSNGASNFSDDNLYGKISDGFNHAVRISGGNSYINFGDVDVSDQFSMYIRFTPDANVSGASYNLFNSGVLFSKWDAGNDLEFGLGYSGGYLRAFASASDGTFMTAQDDLMYSGYQYPLSVVMTHHNSSGLRLYTDNELIDPFNTLRASTAPFTLRTGNSHLVLGNSTGSGIGMNMFVSEFGVSDKANLVDTSGVRGVAPDLTIKESTVDRFLSGHRTKFWQQDTDTTDRYKLWDYIDEDTLDWDLGAFKYCEFSIAFDGFTKRSGRDLISFDINHHGSGYLSYVDHQMPSTLNSGVAYHTQVENDFFRVNLSDASDNFWAADRRITKTVPRGYKFSDRALVVETVLEHNTYNDIIWSDGKVGPKLIVSLYTTNKDPKTYEADNYGLINRDIHYLKPSGCWRRIDSKFTYDNLLDKSESWALFPQEKVLTEFDHKYYSEDINNMFLQYDLVYPSGDSFNSRINIHSAHVRLEDAFINPTESNQNLKLTTSGEKREREQLNMSMAGLCSISNFDLGHSLCSGITQNLYPSGLPLYLLPVSESGIIGSGLNLYASGSLPVEYSTLPLYTQSPPSASGFLTSLYTSGNYRVEGSLPLNIANDNLIYIPSGEVLTLNTFGSNLNTTGVWRNMPLFLSHAGSAGQGTVDNLTGGLSGLPMHTRVSPALFSVYRDGYMNLFTKSPNVLSEQMNLVVWVDTSIYSDLSEYASLNLHTANYGAVTEGSPYLYWSNTNYGLPIEPDDNIYASLSADNEIRGVDLICYGSCSVVGNKKCEEQPLITHNVNWRPDACIDGGIFRSLKTYTNITASGFGPPWYGAGISPSGNYYGVRKYTGLMPGRPYNIIVEGQTGSDKSIEMPRRFEEWEYGRCGPDWSVDGCCTSGCDQNLGYSGVKVVADYPYMADGTHIPSGRIEGDQFGKAVAVAEDFMVVGAPYHEFDDAGGNTILTGVRAGSPTLEWNGGSGLYRGGALFVYRRQAPATGGHKAPWDLEDKVVLPSAFRADYFRNSPGTISFGGLPAIPVRKWHIGQEGRELGWSVAAAKTDKREVIVAGAPSSRWSRNYDDVKTSGVNVGIMVFSDEFKYTGEKGEHLEAVIKEQNFIYKYYSKPINVDNDTVHLNLQLIVCQPTGIFGQKDDNFSLAPFIHHKRMGRNFGATTDEIVQDMKDAFRLAWPYDTSKIHNNIPPVLGLCVDDSRSLGRDDLEPAINQFKEWYEQYSFLSGVKDFHGVQDTGHLHERFPPGGSAEDWVALSAATIRDVVDTGRLVEANAMRFITGGIGIEFANENLTEFNVPPASGGRVYVFEREDQDWQLIQEIKSPKERTYDFPAGWESDPLRVGFSETPDRFGHDVSINKNAEVITIGSPYINDACLIYEHDETERDRLYKGLEGWLSHKGYDATYNKLQDYQQEYGQIEAPKKIYSELTASQKFDLRSDETYWGDNTISEYRKIFKYSYGNIGSWGTWRFIPDKFAPTSRLGYSTDISEDGDTAVFGAPTDSFNEFEDSNVYYKTMNTWSSYVNAGAVRVFGSRKYYPHSGVVEYHKFGNLGRTLDQNNPEHYRSVENSFLTNNVPFSITQFAEDLDIPREAGAAFIITPEIDAASDEIIDKIKSWMSLGDRNLILVGNDPIWEANGTYQKSNDIINKILGKLGSNMRLHAARNEYESLPDCPQEGKPNVIRSFSPAGSRTTDIVSPTMYGHGVADIKIYIPGESYLVTSPCDELNDKCEMWLMHNGDLRAEWRQQCCEDGKCIIEPRNWPVAFGSRPTRCKDQDDLKQYGPEPKPILVAAEYTDPYTVWSPATSGEIMTTVDKKKWIPPKDPITTYKFADTHNDKAEFIWDSGRSDYKQLMMGKYYDPAPFEDVDNDGKAVVRDAVLQYGPSELTVNYKDVVTNLPGGDMVMAAEEPWSGTPSSKVIMIGAVTPESEDMLTQSYDYNVSFYLNLVRQSCTENGRIAQLGGWTNVASFQEAYSESLLKDLFLYKGCYLKENWTGSIPTTSNVCWIACPKGTPSQDDINEIKAWMQTGNKKLVITYPNQLFGAEQTDIDDDYNIEGKTAPSQAIARNVETICEQLGIQMRPTYLSGKQRFATRLEDGKPAITPVTWDEDNEILAGCNDKETVLNFYIEYGMDDMPVMTANPDTDMPSSEKIIQHSTDNRPDFIPVKLGETSKKLIWLPGEKVGDQTVEVVTDKDKTFWQMRSSIATVSFPIDSGLPIAESGYRIFFNWVAENPDEDEVITVNWNNSVTDPNPLNTDVILKDLYDINWSTGKQVLFANIPDAARNPDTLSTDFGLQANSKNKLVLRQNGIRNRVQSKSVDVRILPSGNRQSCCDEIKFYLNSNVTKGKSLTLQPNKNHTVRLVSVSGAMVPIEKNVTISKGYWEEWTEQVGTDKWTVVPGTPTEVPGTFRPIKTDNTKYCSGSTEVEPPTFATREEEIMYDLTTGMLDIEESDSSCKEKGNQLIADGPVLVAEEPENFSQFLSGHKRSRIILISDASMLQGNCGWDKLANREFINSLYPRTFKTVHTEETQSGGSSHVELSDGITLQNSKAGGRNFSFQQKILSPERGSPHKYYAASGLGRLASSFDGGGSVSPATSTSKFVHSASDDPQYNPYTVYRPKDPKGEKAKKAALAAFEAAMYSHGGASMFSGIFEGKMYSDTNIPGTMPSIMQETGSDFLDFDRFPSGYPGDLFGYSVSVDSGRILVGSPFNGFIGDTVKNWDEFRTFPESGLKLSQNGGEGTVYYFENTNKGSGLLGVKPWEFKQKIKASGANIGYDSTDVTLAQSGWNLGSHNYLSSDLANYGFVTDMFGYDVDITSDFIAIGAPGHSFGNFHEHIYERETNGIQYSGAFLRKDFDAQFDIPLHNMYDLGASGTRYSLRDNDIEPVVYSGGDLAVLNNGAVFTYVNDFTDWDNRKKAWRFAEKIIPQGYNSREQKSYSADFTPLPISGAENDHFGRSISLNRAIRTDADYSLAVGAPHHMFATSGNHISSQPLPDAGASYVYNAMLRQQVPSLGSPNNWIIADVYGQLGKDDGVRLTVKQNAHEADTVVKTSGQILANNDGEIFLEASGFDPKTRGFADHRSFIKLVHGQVVNGTPIYDLIYMHTEGEVPHASSMMNLYTDGPDSAYVYNNMGMYVPSVIGIASGEVPSGLVMYLDCPSGVWASGAIPSGLPMYVSGSALINEQLNLRVRGK